MARIVFVPRWLHTNLSAAKIPLTDLVDKQITDLLPNRQDLLGYLKAQVDFAKYLTTSPDTSISVEQRISLNHKAKQILFRDNWPTMIDEVSYHMGMCDKIPEMELSHLDQDAATINDISFKIEMPDLKSIVFVIAQPASDEQAATNNTPDWKKPVSLMRKILDVIYRNHRIHLGHLSRADIVNQNETLYSFYVRNLVFL